MDLILNPSSASHQVDNLGKWLNLSKPQFPQL